MVVDSDFETGWAPVDKLDGSLGFDGGHGGVDVFWNDITSVHGTAGLKRKDLGVVGFELRGVAFELSEVVGFELQRSWV